MKQLIKKAKMLIEEALPYIRKFKGKIFVIKYGGNAMINSKLKHSVMKDIAFLKSLGIKPIIVHGGGPEITKEMKKANLKPKFVNGLRVTDGSTIKIIDKVFKKINNEIKGLLKEFKEQGETVTGCLIAKQKDKRLGLVGRITKVDKKKIVPLYTI